LESGEYQDQGEQKMPSTKDKKDKRSETGSTQEQEQGQNFNDWRKDKDNPRESEVTPRQRSREQTAGTGRKTE
jgi:hypothetical protein